MADTAITLGRSEDFHLVAVSGSCHQSRLLCEKTTSRLTIAGFVVLAPSRVPANVGGLTLVQAAIAAARLIPNVAAA